MDEIDDIGDMTAGPEKYPIHIWLFSPFTRLGRGSFLLLFSLTAVALSPVDKWSFIKYLSLSFHHQFWDEMYWDMRTGHYYSSLWLIGYVLIGIWTLKRLNDMDSKWYWGLIWFIPVVGTVSMVAMLAFSKSFEDNNKYGKGERFRKVIDQSPANEPFV